MRSVRVVVDSGELGSGVVKALEKQDIEIEITTLEVGAYIASGRTAFERMTIDDFFKSLFEDRKLFSQIGDLASSYERPILIIEGEDPFFSGRTVNPGSIQGILKTIAVFLRVPTLFTLNEAETAEVIASIARREQSDEKHPVQLHGKRNYLSPTETREYVISSIPEVGQQVARNLLTHFGSVEKVITASRDELMKVDLVSPETADRIREVVSGAY